MSIILMKYLRLIRARTQQMAQRSNEIMVALPKMSRQQFSDATRAILRFLGDSWDLKQAGFGDESTYKLFLRPNSMNIFKTRDSGPLPVWTGLLSSALPLSQRQILALADSREAYKSDIVRQDKAASVMLRRDGLLKAAGMPLKELEKLLASLERKILDSKYSVWHDLNLEQVEKYECSYFRLEFVNGECIISIKSRLELPRIWKEARENYTLYLTLDEFFVLETLLRRLEDNFQTAKWCCQAPSGVSLPGDVLKRYRTKNYSLGFVETSIPLLLSTLEESRLFSTLTHSPVFVPCQDLRIKLQSNNSPEKDFSPTVFLEDLQSNLSNWCYDSRHVLDLGEIWNDLYPGDWH
ncbi:MAG: hypothetical protein ACFFB3_05110 [Candidatus Hodarchaeota archaeon]